MKIVLISGKAQHGKDTVAELMKDEFYSQGKSVLVTHYADLVKYICKSFFGWDGEKNEVGRTLLQRIGTDVVRTTNPDYWVSFIIDMLKMFVGEWDVVLIPDTRFPNEVSKMKEAFPDNTVHLRVVRDNFKSSLTEEQLSHPSETALDNEEYDYIIHNNEDLISLENKVREFAQSV